MLPRKDIRALLPILRITHGGVADRAGTTKQYVGQVLKHCPGGSALVYASAHALIMEALFDKARVALAKDASEALSRLLNPHGESNA